jgi:hypothetical protein
LVRHGKPTRLKWLGYAGRMQEERMPKHLFNEYIIGVRNGRYKKEMNEGKLWRRSSLTKGCRVSEEITTKVLLFVFCYRLYTVILYYIGMDS